MGCGIHLFVEYSPEGSGYAAWAHDQVALEPNYALFCALAGVRCDRRTARFPARGIPVDLSPEVAQHYYLVVHPKNESLGMPWEPHSVTPELARSYLASGASHRPASGASTGHFTSQHGHVSDPDWHTPSWLLRRELESALTGHEIRPSAELRVLLALLTSLAREFEFEPRVVFWFDN